MSIYNQVNRSHFPKTDQLQSCPNNNFNHTTSRKVVSFDEVITKGKMLWSFSNSINYCFKELWDQFGESAYGYWGLKGYIFTEEKPQYYMHFLFFPLPTSYCNLSEKSCSFTRPLHMTIVNMIVANKSYSKVFVIIVLGPCVSLILTELIC